MAKMADLWHEQFEIDCYLGSFCEECKWNSPNIKQIAFCPNCGSDNIIQGEGAEIAKPKESKKRRGVSVRELQAYRSFYY